METKICTQCNLEKHFKDFHKKYTQGKECNCKLGLKHYYENKDKISYQQKNFFDKKRQTITETKQKIYKL